LGQIQFNLGLLCVGQQREKESDSGDKGEALHFCGISVGNWKVSRIPKAVGDSNSVWRNVYARERERARFE
jgi:hypothetical protein